MWAWVGLHKSCYFLWKETVQYVTQSIFSFRLRLFFQLEKKIVLQK